MRSSAWHMFCMIDQLMGWAHITLRAKLEFGAPAHMINFKYVQRRILTIFLFVDQVKSICLYKKYT